MPLYPRDQGVPMPQGAPQMRGTPQPLIPSQRAAAPQEPQQAAPQQAVPQQAVPQQAPRPMASLGSTSQLDEQISQLEQMKAQIDGTLQSLYAARQQELEDTLARRQHNMTNPTHPARDQAIRMRGPDGVVLPNARIATTRDLSNRSQGFQY